MTIRRADHRHRSVRGLPAAAFCVACLLVAPGASAQEFLEDAQMVDLRVSANSYRTDRLESGGGILSDGTPYSFRPWYDGDLADLRLTMFTPTSENFGVYWGFGTGESGEKYEIDPSLKVGFLATEPVGENALLSLSVSVVVGGYLREKTCTADYGAIGGIQAVNCRMAGSPMPPSETLSYLIDRPPGDQVQVTLRYRWLF